MILFLNIWKNKVTLLIGIRRISIKCELPSTWIKSYSLQIPFHALFLWLFRKLFGSFHSLVFYHGQVLCVLFMFLFYYWLTQYQKSEYKNKIKSGFIQEKVNVKRNLSILLLRMDNRNGKNVFMNFFCVFFWNLFYRKILVGMRFDPLLLKWFFKKFDLIYYLLICTLWLLLFVMIFYNRKVIILQIVNLFSILKKALVYQSIFVWACIVSKFGFKRMAKSCMLVGFLIYHSI